MNNEQFSEICNKLDKIFGVLAVQNIDDVDDKIYALKNLGFTSKEINPIVGVKNVRQKKGWRIK